MHIDRLRIQNFKQFVDYTLELDRQFNLLVGENGSGKTTVLEALTVALGVWLVKPPDPELSSSRRNIYKHEVRLESKSAGDRTQFFPCRPVRIEAEGQIVGESLRWVRQVSEQNYSTINKEARQALDWIARCIEDDARQRIIFPVLAYYGAGRAWLPSNERPSTKAGSSPSRRWSAFYDCFHERVHFSQLTDWFRREALAALNGKGYRPGYEVVQSAIIRCLPGARRAWFDGDRQEVVVSLGDEVQPLNNLSAGQKMMLAMVADLAMKVVTQNNWMVESYSEASQLPLVLEKTPGVVLIDELDVHLHPLWQRRIIQDLTSTFPAIQFVATTHSPFIIQALGNGKLTRLGGGDVELWPHGESIEDIAEAVQGVQCPQQSQRARRLELATERYFSLLKSKSKADPRELAAAEVEFREASQGFSTQPGLEAILKLEALSSQYGSS